MVYLTSVGVGALLGVWLPGSFLPPTLAVPLGVLLVAAALSLFVLAVHEFGKFQTPVLRTHPSTTVVSTGPYRFTKNPIYVAYTLSPDQDRGLEQQRVAAGYVGPHGPADSVRRDRA